MIHCVCVWFLCGFIPNQERLKNTMKEATMSSMGNEKDQKRRETDAETDDYC